MSERQQFRFTDLHQVMERLPEPCQSCEYGKAFARRESSALRATVLPSEAGEQIVKNVFSHSAALWQVCQKADALHEHGQQQALDTQCNMK